MNNKKILYIILACVIIIGAVIIGFKGLNFGLKYEPNKQIEIYIGKEFDNNDIKQMVREVIENKQVIVQKVELYEEMVSITVKEISDTEIEELNNKINEKYGIDNKVSEDLIITENANLRGRDLVKTFIFPIAVSLIIILVYAAIRFRKINIFEILVKLFGINILAQLLYISILAITRLPVNILTVPTAIAIYTVVTLLIFNEYETKERELKKEQKN